MAENRQPKRLTPARERILRAIGRGEVICDPGGRLKGRSITKPRWMWKGETVTAPYQALEQSGLVLTPTTRRPDDPTFRQSNGPLVLARRVVLTPAGREWLDANPEKEN